MAFDAAAYDFIIFDCDGVILNSNNLKSRAFAAALPGEPEDLVGAFVDYHQRYGGVSRYEKFRHYYRELKKVAPASIEPEAEAAIARFASIVKSEMNKCEYIPGVMDFIDKLKKSGQKMFVVTGSDEKELIEIFQKRKILDRFAGVFGSPTKKEENVKKVLDIVGQGKKGIFFGDTETDYDAANKHGLDFVFVSGVSEWRDGQSVAKKNGLKMIKNFVGITT